MLSSIILKCREDGDATQAGIAIWKDTFEKATLKRRRTVFKFGPRQHFDVSNEFGMLRLVYSMVLSRGANRIQRSQRRC